MTLPTHRTDRQHGTDSDRTDRDPDRGGAGSTDRDESPPPVVTDGGVAWTDLTGFQRDLLKSIRRCTQRDAVPTGQAIKEEMERQYRKSITNGRLYQNLNYLVEHGLLAKGFVDGRTNIYDLTDDAAEMLDDTVHRFANSCGIEIAAHQE